MLPRSSVYLPLNPPCQSIHRVGKIMKCDLGPIILLVVQGMDTVQSGRTIQGLLVQKVGKKTTLNCG